MIDYTRTYADKFGVEPILTVLNEHGIGIAPSTYYAHAARGFEPTEQELDDAYAANALFTLWVKNRRLYGRRKLWKTALRAGIEIGRDQVERLMKLVGIDGVRRGKHRTVTTRRDPRAPRHPDHVRRRWAWPSRPDLWWVADFTYVWTIAGFCYISFITDVYSRRILGWRVTTTKTTPLVLSALEQALFTRRRTSMEFTGDGLLHHSDAGSPSTPRWRSPKPSTRPGSPAPSGVWVTPSTTRSWNPPSGCSRPKSSTTNKTSGRPGDKSSKPPLPGSTGTTTNVSTPRSETSHRSSTKTTTML